MPSLSPTLRPRRRALAPLWVVALAALAVSGAAAQPVGADTLSEVEAVARALAAAPSLRAADAALDLARAERAVAGALFTENPELDVDLAVEPLEALAPGDYGMGASVTQTFERPAVRRARRRAASGALAVAEVERRAARLDLAAEARAAVTELAAAQEAADLAREALVAADSLVAVERLRYSVGDVSELDLRLAEADAAATAAEVLLTEAELAQARAALARLLVLPVGTTLAVPSLDALPPVPLPADTVRVDSLTGIGGVDTLGVAGRADVRAAALAAEAAALEADYRRTSRRFSAFAVSVGLERSSVSFGPDDLSGTSPFGDDFELGRRETEVTLGFSIPLPFGGVGRRELARAEALARLRQAEAEAVRYGAAAEASAALVGVRQADRVLDRLTPVEPELAEAEALLTLARRGGEIDVPTLIAQRERLRAVRRALLDARAEARRARLELARALGRPTAGLPLDVDPDVGAAGPR